MLIQDEEHSLKLHSTLASARAVKEVQTPHSEGQGFFGKEGAYPSPISEGSPHSAEAVPLTKHKSKWSVKRALGMKGKFQARNMFIYILLEHITFTA